MKKTILFSIACFAITTASAQFAQFDATFDMQHGDIVTADVDNDGDLDIIVSGETGNPATVKNAIFINNGGTYTLQGTENVITPGHFADIKLGDIDGDGDLDVIFNGNSNGNMGKGIALNDGSGNFTRSTLDVTTATISCGFADFNNDGLLDYYVIGNGTANMGTLFFQNVDGTFTKDQSSFTNLNLIDADISTVDFNNDGYIDMFISAWDDTAKSRYSAILINDGFGKFTAMAQPNLIRKGYGSSVWGDVDGDGWLDLLLNGDGGADGEGSSDIYRLYKNNGGSLEPKATFNDYRQISVGDGSRLVDWDNDGDLDIILTGWSGTKGRQVTMLFECTNAANFTYVENALSNTDFPGVSECSIETADLNNDGKIDLMITGYNGDQATQVGKFNRNICGYVLNQSATVNTKPTAPTALTNQFTQSGTETLMTLSWAAATDAQTPQKSLTYNLALKNTTTGKWFYNPMAVIGGTTDGWRKVSSHGNVFTNKRWELYNLPNGRYEWTVQAIDANFMGGSFAATKTFTIGLSGVEKIISGVTVQTNAGTLTIKNSSSNALDVNVYNLTGGLLKSVKTNSDFNMPLNKGIYLVKMSNGIETITQKVVL
ncbi:MAG: T9SS type A sorting domain-containing protein [Paludibacter sp.]|nr:T9SS type A sorting domain-containing protein [Paludibacter sp.]